RLKNDGLNDGDTDPTINFGAGANSFIYSAVIQPDRNILIGGGFTIYDGQARQFIARIYGGAIIGPGKIEFAAANYSVLESGTNATITLRRVGGTTTIVSANFTTANGSAVAGTDYLATN